MTPENTDRVNTDSKCQANLFIDSAAALSGLIRSVGSACCVSRGSPKRLGYGRRASAGALKIAVALENTNY